MSTIELLLKVAQQQLKKLDNESGEAANLGVLDGHLPDDERYGRDRRAAVA